jgi:hypothetical protein
MATNTSTPFLTVGRVWDMLQPGMPNPPAHTKDILLLASVSYPMGQVLAPHDTLAGVYVPPTHANAVAGSRLLVLPYPFTTDANGNASFGTVSNANESKLESPFAYYTGAFRVADLVGVADAATLARLGKLVQGIAYNDANAIVELT